MSAENTLEINKIYLGNCVDVLQTFPSESINCCITSPPYYGLRDYGVNGQFGNESTPEQYIENLVTAFEEVRRVLKDDGVLWPNLGDSWVGSNQGVGTKPLTAKQASNRGTNYMTTANHKSKLSKLNEYKPKDLIGIPWMTAFALRNAGWYLRQDIIWAKGNPMSESVRDRCVKSHEYIFLLSKSRKYYFDYEAIKEPRVSHHGSGNKQRKQRPNSDVLHKGCQAGSIPYDDTNQFRNKRDVWNVNIKPCKEAHFATFPDVLIEPCVLAGCPENGIVLDPFIGSGTTGMVAKRNGRNYVGIELNPDYIEIAKRRISQVSDSRVLNRKVLF